MVHLIPRPNLLREEAGTLTLTRHTVLSGAFASCFPLWASLLPDAPGEKNRLIFRADPEIPPEGCRITWEGDDLLVSAADSRGGFYAVMSLLQLVNSQGILPRVTVEDSPRYSYRGFMLDCARHFWTIPQIRRVIDIMAMFKLNVLHLHLTDDQGWRMEIKKYPLLTEVGSIRKNTKFSKRYTVEEEYGRGMFYTQDEMRELVAYAKQRCVDILPEIEMPGHSIAALTAYPNLSCTGAVPQEPCVWVNDQVAACCGNDDYEVFVRDIIDELVDIFPFPFFHIGGDEVRKKGWQKCPRCQAKIKKLGLADEAALQAHFNRGIAEYLRSKGKRMMGWNEILRMDEENLDPDAIVELWIVQSHIERERKWIARNRSLVLADIHSVYFNLPYAFTNLQKTYEYGADVMELEDAPSILGLEAALWTEFIDDFEMLELHTSVRLAALAEAAWTRKELRDYADFEARLEDQRDALTARGVLVPPRQVYHGKTYDEAVYGKTDGWDIWCDDPRFEMKWMQNLLDQK